MIYKDKKEAAKKIAPIFDEMEWMWRNTINPKEADILEQFEEFEERLMSDDIVSNSTGRLFAEKIRDTNEIVYGLEHTSADEWADSHD